MKKIEKMWVFIFQQINQLICRRGKINIIYCAIRQFKFNASFSDYFCHDQQI